MSIARHYIDEPPEGEPPFGYCPRCEYALVDAHECRCGWNEYEATDEGAANHATVGAATAVAGAQAPESAGNPASPVYRRRGGEG